jgi:hypothetical protein
MPGVLPQQDFMDLQGFGPSHVGQLGGPPNGGQDKVTVRLILHAPGECNIPWSNANRSAFAGRMEIA